MKPTEIKNVITEILESRKEEGRNADRKRRTVLLGTE